MSACIIRVRYLYWLCLQAKNTREQKALANAKTLFKELDAEREKKESRRKAAAKKRDKRKKKKQKEQAEKRVCTLTLDVEHQ